MYLLNLAVGSSAPSAPHTICPSEITDMNTVIISRPSSSTAAAAAIWTTEGGRRQMAEVNKKPRSITFLRQRLSVAVQRGNAACILGTLRPVVGGSY